PLAVFELESPFVVLYWIDVEDAQPKFVDFVGIDQGVLQESLAEGNFSAVFRDNWSPFLEEISSSATSPLPVILTGLRNQSLSEAVLSELDGEQATIPVVDVTEPMTEQWPEIDPSCFAAAGAAVAPLTRFRREATVADDEVMDEPQNEVEPDEIFNDTLDSQRRLQLTCANRPLFRRVYYENVLLERNDLRGAASQSELAELVGLELGFEFDASGIKVHCLSGPSVQIGNRTLEAGDVLMLAESENCLRLSGLELQLHVMGF
ncbi:MAG: hypothetical protein KDA84_27760, partial [Planctomycetaceae bacterium]|nr:hypothetical protein [Planctomycetaceae bacterium]